jgi:hypothetical protein
MCNLGVGITRIDSDNRVDHFTWSSRARRMRISPGTNGSNPFPSSEEVCELSVPEPRGLRARLRAAISANAGTDVDEDRHS